MALEGSVADFGLVDVFQMIAMQRKSGQLTLSNGNKSVVVSFINGNLFNAVEGDEGERFANALMTAERITLVQFRSALRMADRNVPIGETFIKLAYLTPEEVREWNQTLTQETIFDILSWATGSYRFDPDAAVLDSEYYPQVGVEQTLMEGMRQKDEWPGLLKKVRSKTMVLEVVAQEAGSGDFEDPQEHLWLLKWVDGVRTVEGIVNHAGVGAFPVYKCLGELIADGRLKEVEKKVAPKKRGLGLPSLKDIIAFGITFFNKLLLCFIILLLITFFIPSFYGVNSVIQKIRASMKEVSVFTAQNKKERIAFSLDLYYIKHNHYPKTLDQLKKSGFIEEAINLMPFQYHSNGKSYSLTLEE